MENGRSSCKQKRLSITGLSSWKCWCGHSPSLLFLLNISTPSKRSFLALYRGCLDILSNISILLTLISPSPIFFSPFPIKIVKLSLTTKHSVAFIFMSKKLLFYSIGNYTSKNCPVNLRRFFGEYKYIQNVQYGQGV